MNQAVDIKTLYEHLREREPAMLADHFGAMVLRFETEAKGNDKIRNP